MMDGNVTFQVDMNQYADPFTTVYVSGAFNGWSGNSNALEDADGDGVWTGTILMPAGAQEFKYSIDDWAAQEDLMEGSSCTITTDGFTNRIITVDGDATLDVVCFNSCDACVAGVDGMVSFSVDMNQVATAFTTVYVSGEFNGWSGTANPLDDSDGDGIWTGTILMPAGAQEFKYSVDDWADSEQLSQGAPCTIVDPTGAFVNRIIFVDGDMEIPTVCYGLCGPCLTGADVMVTFNVNMEFHPVDPTGVFVAGGDFGPPGSIELTDPDGDNVYSATIIRQEGFSSFYTFTNGNCPDYSCKENIGGQDCANPSNFNDRFLPTLYGDVVINTCYEECTTDLMCSTPSEPIDVTFQIDMSNEVTSPDGVFIGSNIDSWSGEIAMEDLDGDDIWTTTLNLEPGFYEFLYINGAEWCCQEVLDSGSCTVNPPFNNRFVTVEGDSPITLELSCFNSCSECEDVGLEEIDNALDLFSIQPNPVSANGTVLQFVNNNNSEKTIRLLDTYGRLILEEHTNRTNYALATSQLSSGIYLISVVENNKIATQKLIVSK